MRLSFGGLSADIPDGWTDQSTISFVMPPDEDLKTPMSLNKQRGPAGGNFVINWVDVGEQAPGDLLEAQLAALPATLRDFEVVDRGDRGTSDEPRPFAEIRFNLSITVRQLVCVRRIGARDVVLTASASEPLYPRIREQAFATFDSLAVASSG